VEFGVGAVREDLGAERRAAEARGFEEHLEIGELLDVERVFELPKLLF